jgi:predicted HD phosphohydrolase
LRLPFLRGLFPPAVLEPIRLHVDAKRYICATDSAYFLQLSDDSKRSLVLQGGIFSSEEARSFIEKPYAEDAVQLRRRDDKAKMKNMKTPAFGDFVSVMQACAIS